jgi:hypothetical protein
LSRHDARHNARFARIIRWMKMKMMNEFDDGEDENEDEGEYE